VEEGFDREGRGQGFQDGGGGRVVEVVAEFLEFCSALGTALGGGFAVDGCGVGVGVGSRGLVDAGGLAARAVQRRRAVVGALVVGDRGSG